MDGGAVAAALQLKKKKDKARKEKKQAAGTASRFDFSQSVLVPGEASHNLSTFSSLPPLNTSFETHNSGHYERQGTASVDKLQVDKQSLIERMVLEDVMETIFIRCVLFFFLFIFLLSMMWISFPSSSFGPVHQSIIDGFDLTGSFSEVKTVKDVQSYLKSAAAKSHEFSPSSVAHFQDMQSKSYIPEPRTLPPVMQLGVDKFPTLTTSFTMMVWVKTKVRLDTIIRKSANGITCWSVGPEALVFGEHDSYSRERVVHPWATSIYAPGVMIEADAWKVSKIMKEVSDNTWHHLGFRVNATHVDFVHDGTVIRGKSGDPLDRPMTDCPEGTVTIGSERFVAEMSDFVFFNRRLSDHELRDTYVAGRPISVLLSGSGPMASEESYTVKEQLADVQTTVGRRFRELKDEVLIGQRNSMLEHRSRNGTTSNTSATTASSTTATTTTTRKPKTLPAVFYDSRNSCSKDSGKYTEPQMCETTIIRDAVAIVRRGRAFQRRIQKDVCSIAKKLFPASDDTAIHKTVVPYLQHFRDKCFEESKERTSSVKPEHVLTMNDAAFKSRLLKTSCKEDLAKKLSGDTTANNKLFAAATVIFLQSLKRAVLLVQQEACRVRADYRDTCPVTCGLPCTIPRETSAVGDTCADSGTHVDAWGNHCAWYQVYDEACSRYASDDTKQQCALTCNSCTRARPEIPSESNGVLVIENLNALLVKANRVDMLITRNLAYSYVAYYCCLERESRGASGKEAWRSAIGKPGCDAIKPSLDAINDLEKEDFRGNFVRDYPECFPSDKKNVNELLNIGFPSRWFNSESSNIIARILTEGATYGGLKEQLRPVFLETRSAVDRTRTVQNNVQLMRPDRLLSTELSLTIDTPEWQWKPCTKHVDCTALVFVCRPEHNSTMCNNLQRLGLPPQKQFCSSRCWTSGCTHLGDGGKVCQPCDACVGTECSDACSGSDKPFDAVEYQMKVTEAQKTATDWQSREVHSNTFSVSAWVKDFQYQSIMEKRVNVTLPPSFADAEGYNSSTGEYICYRLSVSDFCFRTFWYDKTLTCIPNSLSEKLQDDKWHHIAVVKSASEKTATTGTGNQKVNLKKRVDEFTFFVDGKKSSSTKHESIVGQVTPLIAYGLSDCGGPMVSTAEVTHAHDDATQGEDATDFAHRLHKMTRTEFSHLLPLGKKSTAVLRFAGLNVPKNAVIKEAYLELSAAQNPVLQAIESMMCGAKGSTTRSTDKIPLYIFSPTVDILQNPCSEHRNETACTSRECTWADGQCTGGVFDGPCSPWRGPNQLLRSNGTYSRVAIWNVEPSKWRKTNLRAANIVNIGDSVMHGAYNSTAYDAATETGAVRISPDIRKLVQDILSRDSYDPEKNRTVVTFALRGSEAKGDTCESTIGYDTDSMREMDTCEGLQHLSDFVDTEFPLFALSNDGARHVESGSAPRLRVHWCLTKDCISPTFDGAGDNVQWGRQGFTVSSNHPELRPPATVEDTSVSQPATPTYHDIPRMFFGVSTMADQDPLSEGKLFDLRTMPRAMTLRDVQKTYYANIQKVPYLPGPQRAVDAQSEQSQLDVSAYHKEVFSIAPPIILQTRNKAVPCGQLAPALGSALTKYFKKQTRTQCTKGGPYTCTFPYTDNELTCMDRREYATSSHFGRSSVIFANVKAYFPEFLELMNLPTVYREGKMLSAHSWVDMESSTIVVISVFLAPIERLGTVMQLEFENQGAGNIQSSYSLSSFKQMIPREQVLWTLLACAIIICCLLEIGFIISSVILRVRERKNWQVLVADKCKKRMDEKAEVHADFNAQEMESMVQDEFLRLQRHRKVISRNVPIVNVWDVFDVVLRLLIFISVVMYMASSFSPALLSSDPREQLGNMEKHIKGILQLEWHSHDILYSEKVQNFVNRIRDIVTAVGFLREMRTFSAILILVCLFRLIVYMRVHPKVACLYKTIAAAMDDLLHFSLTFTMLYLVLAFIATWTFGAVDTRYGTFADSCYEQFNMIIGEFPMDPVIEKQGLYVAYLFVFCVLMFLTLMNFFLALIIDSYSAIKDQVGECTVSKNFVTDLYHTYAFYYHRWVRKWPSRAKLIRAILQADMDENSINDQEQSIAVLVNARNLVANSIFIDFDSANEFIAYYLNISRSLAGSKKHDKSAESVLEHHIALRRLLQLDLISHHHPGGEVREVHPLGRRADETKTLVRQFMRTGQKILQALRVNKTQFTRDKLLLDDTMGDPDVTMPTGDKITRRTLHPEHSHMNSSCVVPSGFEPTRQTLV